MYYFLIQYMIQQAGKKVKTWQHQHNIQQDKHYHEHTEQTILPPHSDHLPIRIWNVLDNRDSRDYVSLRSQKCRRLLGTEPPRIRYSNVHSSILVTNYDFKPYPALYPKVYHLGR